MKIVLASDHAGVELKSELIAFLEAMDVETKDLGPYSNDSVDYPDFAHPLAEAVETEDYSFGVAICGSGNGINITVNKHQGIRSALCWNSEIASLARQHNNANVLALPARFISVDLAKEILNSFITSDFEGGRHQKRVDKIACQ